MDDQGAQLPCQVDLATNWNLICYINVSGLAWCDHFVIVTSVDHSRDSIHGHLDLCVRNSQHLLQVSIIAPAWALRATRPVRRAAPSTQKSRVNHIVMHG